MCYNKSGLCNTWNLHFGCFFTWTFYCQKVFLKSLACFMLLIMQMNGIWIFCWVGWALILRKRALQELYRQRPPKQTQLHYFCGLGNTDPLSRKCSRSSLQLDPIRNSKALCNHNKELVQITEMLADQHIHMAAADSSLLTVTLGSASCFCHVCLPDSDLQDLTVTQPWKWKTAVRLSDPGGVQKSLHCVTTGNRGKRRQEGLGSKGAVKGGACPRWPS